MCASTVEKKKLCRGLPQRPGRQLVFTSLGPLKIAHSGCTKLLIQAIKPRILIKSLSLCRGGYFLLPYNE